MKHALDQSLAAAMAGASAEEQADLLIAYMNDRGQTFYDEEVTQLAHGIQSAMLARNAGASAEAVAGALLHDIGHLLVEDPPPIGDFLHEDLIHEEVGAEYLEPFFGPAVLEPIRLHVAAKRYICSTDPTYIDGLSDGSKRSFRVQGGSMSAEELAEMEKNPFLQEALDLRRWDDGGKSLDLEMPPAEDFRDELIAALEAK